MHKIWRRHWVYRAIRIHKYCGLCCRKMSVCLSVCPWHDGIMAANGNICQSYGKNKSCILFWDTVYCVGVYLIWVIRSISHSNRQTNYRSLKLNTNENKMNQIVPNIAKLAPRPTWRTAWSRSERECNSYFHSLPFPSENSYFLSHSFRVLFSFPCRSKCMRVPMPYRSRKKGQIAYDVDSSMNCELEVYDMHWRL